MSDDLARLNAAIDHCGILGDSTHPFDWVPPTPAPLDLTGYVETFRDDFTWTGTIMAPTGTGGKWYSPVHSYFGYGETTGRGSFDKSQVTVNSNLCKIRIERTAPPSPTSDWGTWKAGHIQTMNAAGQGFAQPIVPGTPVYFEARIKLPKASVPFGWQPFTGAPISPQFPQDGNGARGSWPSFWLLSKNGYVPDGNHLVEIDLMECYGGDQNLHSTVHLKPRAIPEPRDPPARQTNSDTEDLNYLQWDGNFHTYGGLFDDDFLTIYFDGVATKRYEMNKFLQTPMYLNISHALFPGKMDKTATPLDMYIDYVRVLAKTTAAPPPPPPPTTGFPDATNTGPVASTVFSAPTGSITISTAGTYNGLVVNGWVTVTASSGVIITNSKVTGGGIQADNGKTITVKNCIIDGQTQQGAGIQAFGYFDANNIRGFENGIVVQSGNNGWAKGNYIHDLTSPAADGHYDGIAIQEAVDGYTLDNNAIWGRDTSCVFLKGNWGAIKNITISNNLLRIQPGQESKTAYVINVDGRVNPITNLKVLNNKAQKAAFGYFTFDTVAGPITVTGNTDYATGAAVS